MAPLAEDLRKDLEKAIVKARDEAEAAARASLTTLAVERDEPHAGMDEPQRWLRRALRAKARQLGGGSRLEGMPALVEEIAYEQWHRMIFARFLAENELLMHPSGVAVTLADCADLAAEEGEPDAWLLAARYASAMLPGIFGADDPSAQVRFAAEHRTKLEAILAALPVPVFTADDALGWVYQFWQTKQKDAVNKSGRKIGGRDISPVTQLFTEDYMVRFLLENSLGAWWAARHPESPLLKEWDYLRFRDDGTPAAGTFPGWPERAAEVTVMDPCCGSGHFLVAAFEMLRRMRMEEEGLDEVEAVDAVLRDNLHGLEIDPRCTQIAAFALAFAAWKAGGYRHLPLPHIACSGIAVRGQLESWTRLAGDDRNLAAALERLYNLFKDAPTLGSLIDPANVPERDRMFTPDYDNIEPLLEHALKQERDKDDPTATVFGEAAEGVVRAAKLLASKYTLVATNVPYLTRSKQDNVLKQFCDVYHPKAMRDLATAFVERCSTFSMFRGSYAIVTPQNWLSQESYTELRETLLQTKAWNSIVWLGAGAFDTITGEVVKPTLVITSNEPPETTQILSGLDASQGRSVADKANLLVHAPFQTVLQASQLRNPDARISLVQIESGALLDAYAIAPQGIKTGDDDRWRRVFWELLQVDNGWEFYQSTVRENQPFGGREYIIDWSLQGRGMPCRRPRNEAIGKRGVAVSQMGDLAATIYSGERYDSNVAPIVPKEPSLLAPIWAFCQSREYRSAVRRIDRKMSITNGTLLKVPFDLKYWQEVADQAGPLPEPYTNDPTQWLFEGQAKDSTDPLHVAVARLLGYHWPQQKKVDDLDDHTDVDGIACLPAVGGEQPAEERLRALLAATYGADWSQSELDRLLDQVDYGGKTLGAWLRDGFWTQHCRLFHNHPFIWHIWDGRKDGFAALVNYHKLDAARFDKLIYTYLGQWIDRQRAKSKGGDATAEGRLVAALDLQARLVKIREGEPPYDIYVRWKPLHQQPMGWEPDLNDGVRLNIRPFVKAEVLRGKFTINWNKDGGKNPDDSDRHNDCHHTLAEKRAAREAAGV